MNDEILDAEYTKGQTVLATRDVRARRVSGYGYVTISAGDELLITRVTSGSVHARIEDGYVFAISKDALTPIDYVPRKLRDVPEGMLSPDDPRLAWLWEDAGKLANRWDQCSTYDKFCDVLGLPGRMRNFNVSKKLPSGIEIRATIEAHSLREAEQMLEGQLSTDKATSIPTA
jgi:hypothetical protein